MKNASGETLMNKKRLSIIIGIVVVVVVLVVVFDTLLANHLPAIASLTAPERVVPSESCEIVCNATDSDGGELSYNWSASAGELNGEGATVTWIAPDSVGSYNITVTVTDGRGGDLIAHVTDYVIIEVRRNQGPRIESVVADADWSRPSDALQVTCSASDPDDDELDYNWTATDGHIAGTGAVVNWTAPEQAGRYDITVVTTDGHDRSDTRKLYTSVVTGEPPDIEPLHVTAEHCYLKAYSWGYKVGKEQKYDIECIVSDTSAAVSYDWLCEDGTISGEGSMIAWTAPNENLYRTTVTVVVSDTAGDMVCKSVLLEVVNCSPCTFGC